MGLPRFGTLFRVFSCVLLLAANSVLAQPDIGGGSGAGGSGDITDVFDCSTGNCASITTSGSDLLDMSGQTPAANRGFLMLQGTDCSSAITEGQLCWDTDDNVLYIGDGAAAASPTSGDITDVFNCANGDCNDIALADGDRLNMSSVNPNTTTEGLIFPQGLACTSATAEGQVCWDTDGDTLYVGDGTAAAQIVMGTANITQAADCSGKTALGDMCIDTDNGVLYIGNGTAAEATILGSVSTIDQAADCSTFIAIGQLCIDTDDGAVYAGDGAEAVALIEGLTTPTLDSVFDTGKTIDGANSQANAMVVGDGTDGLRLYVGTGGPIIECFQGAGTCDIIHDIPSGNDFILKYNTTTGITIDSSGNVTLTNALIETKSFYFGSGSLSTDGTQCADPAEVTINSGPKVWGISCTDNAGSIIYGSVGMPDSYNGGTVTFELQAENENATPSGVLDFDFSAMCRGDGDTINSTWGTAANASITFANQYVLEHATTAAVTPNGTCAAGDTLFWRAVMDDTSTTTQVASTYILGIKMEYPTNDWSDN